MTIKVDSVFVIALIIALLLGNLIYMWGSNEDKEGLKLEILRVDNEFCGLRSLLDDEFCELNSRVNFLNSRVNIIDNKFNAVLGSISRR